MRLRARSSMFRSRGNSVSFKNMNTTARKYVVSFLHYTGENAEHINNTIDSDVRYLHADGFGNLSQCDHLDRETLLEMLFDWSHVRDSSDEAFEAMANALSEAVALRAKLLDEPLLVFENFKANEFATA